MSEQNFTTSVYKSTYILLGFYRSSLLKMHSVSCLSLIDCDPVCCGKPFVAFDVVDAVLQVAVPFGQIHL